MDNNLNKSLFNKKNVILISLSHLVHDIFTIFLSPILPLLIEKHSMSYSLAGLLSVVGRIPSLFNPVIGYIADKVAVKYFVIFAPLISSVCMCLLGAAPNILTLVLLLLGMGVGSAIYHVPAPVLVSKVSGKQIGKGMSWYMLAGEAARAIGPLVILGAISIWGLEGTWRLIPLGLFATVFLYIKFKDIAISEEVKKKSITNNNHIKIAIKKMIPFFIVIAGLIFFRALIKSSITSFLPTYLASKGMPLYFSGIALAIVQACGALGTFLSGGISDRLGRRNTLLFLFIVSTLLMLVFVNLNSMIKLILLPFIGASLFATGPVLLALVNECKSTWPSFVNSIYMTLSFFLGAVAMFIVGALADKVGLDKAYLIATIFSFGAIPFLAKVKN